MTHRYGTFQIDTMPVGLVAAFRGAPQTKKQHLNPPAVCKSGNPISVAGSSHTSGSAVPVVRAASEHMGVALMVVATSVWAVVGQRGLGLLKRLISSHLVSYGSPLFVPLYSGLSWNRGARMTKCIAFKKNVPRAQTKYVCARR